MSDSENKETFSDSSDQFTEDEWIFYRDRPEWKDIEPVELKEGSFPVVAIAYSDRCMSLLFVIIILLGNCIFKNYLLCSQRRLQLLPCYSFEK